MKRKSILTFAVLAALATVNSVHSDIVEYTDEAAFLAAVNNLPSQVTFTESFEPIQQGVMTEWTSGTLLTSATHHDVTWSRPTDVGNGTLRTGDLAGAAHTVPGVALINSDGALGIRDANAGYRLEANGFAMFAVGGWLKASTTSKPVFILDRGAGTTLNDSVDLGAPNVAEFSGHIGSSWTFRGVIDVNGFSTVDIVDVEGAIGDEAFPFFSDDFYLTRANAIPEPSITALLASFGATVLMSRRRRHKCS